MVDDRMDADVATVRISIYDCSVNENGHPETLITSHPANKNAMKSGVYSERVRNEAESAIRQSLQTLPLGEVLTDVRIKELTWLLTLGDLLDADLKQNGSFNRRGEARRQVGQLLRLTDKIESLLAQIRLEGERLPNRLPDGRSQSNGVDREARLERYSALRAIAFERCDVLCRDRIRAMKALVSMPKPPEPSALALVSDQELDAWMNAWMECGMQTYESEPADSGDDKTSAPSSQLSDLDRCIAEL